MSDMQDLINQLSDLCSEFNRTDSHYETLWQEACDGAEKISKLAIERAKEIKALKVYHDEFIGRLKAYRGSLFQFIQELEGADNG